MATSLMNYTGMNMKRFATALILTVALAGGLTGCSDFLDINEDPNSATREQLEQVPENLIPQAAAQLAVNKSIENYYGSLFSQTWSGVGFGLFVDSDRYVVGGTTFNNTFVNNYQDAAGNFTQVIEIAERAQSDPGAVPYNPTNVRAQAEILRQYTYFYITSFFGAVPYTEANRVEQFPEPSADPQEEILRGIIAELDTAVTNIDPAKQGIGGDFFYEGNLDNWERFANTIKLKAYFLLLSGEGSRTGSGVEGALPNENDLQTEIENLIAEGDLIQENSQNFAFPYLDEATQENPIYGVSKQFSAGENIAWACSEEIVDQMLAEGEPRGQDPRLRLYCQEDQLSGSEFTGVPPGGAGSGSPLPVNGGINQSVVSDVIHRPESPEEFATAAEVRLKEAEWAFRNGNPSTARTKLEEGIRLSINEVNGYPNVASPVSESEINAYLNSLPSAGNLTLEDIQLQQWIDLFERQIDVWNQWRRTKVPDLTPAANAATDGGVIPRRYNIPQSERSANPNLESRQIETPVWFEGPSANN